MIIGMPVNSTTTTDSVPSVVCAGLVVADAFVAPVPTLPTAGALVVIDEILHDVGGCAANTATVLAKLGVSARVSGVTGSDGSGDALRIHLEHNGVDVAGLLTTDAAATSETVILPITGEDRRYFHVVGANAAFTARDIAAAAAGTSVLVIGGFLALPGVHPSQLADVLRTARESGTKTVLDVVVPAGSTDSADQLREVLPFVDCFLPNEDEAFAITGETDPAEQARALLAAGCASVVITRGAAGAFYADAHERLHVGSLPVEFIDGSGAGDAFTAGVALGLLEGMPARDWLRLASAIGASATRGLGCTTTVFTRDEALAALPRITLEPAS
jgi:sugar/nucleoside kinase (ribokinase family)